MISIYTYQFNSRGTFELFNALKVFTPVNLLPDTSLIILAQDFKFADEKVGPEAATAQL